ncbi:SNF2- related helicase [Bifidobacterium reuteri DSM 23975]|uniref:SNF2-related helicase n=1 Tax=Bifidobacterium reuteri DSM 23975 TaxID=1437610 RepID=A0A087CXC0_9BIFI|nr:DEAD/DEAH box helicase [Bifidobacterium reuteri]KFI87920.1 SNF2- related helicase [Bifidobacterium reuteri DSM 23975]
MALIQSQITDNNLKNQQSILSPGMRVLVRGQEWLISKVETNSLGNHAVTCTGISPLVRDSQSTFLDDLDDIEPVDPVKTRFIPDMSEHADRSHLFIESLLRSTAPTDQEIHVGDKAAMDSLPYQLVPAKQALSQPRQRILIADAVGLGKTLEAGILMSELIKRHKGRRILVVTAKSMMLQFQKEMWERFTIPLISLDSSRIQQIRSEIPANANPFSYYDKVIVSIDTIKRDIQYGAALDASYWDIIVIDEAQNVADRSSGSRKAQRSRLAQRLASRSDTLIMLSATPHDGKARSFASLMNMLDPTTLPDPDNYTKADIRQLYVRRFKKDVIGDVSGRFPERKVTQIHCEASSVEEEAFDCLTSMHLRMDVNRRNANSGLFRTLLEKSLFSSPAACIATIDARLKKLRKIDSADRTGDAAKLEEFRSILERITPRHFSRYVQLLSMLRNPAYGWDGKRPDDRIVIFTERIETKNYLESRLREDLSLPKGAIVSMDGQMSDLDQQKIVEQFGKRTSPIRVLIASDVASEGLNLHYLSHRLIHFDTPWSLMVFQQRNGRIDRYGQREQPDIRFMAIDSHNEKIKGDARILEILREKEQQAYSNIGDPALLMGKFDIEDEEAVTRNAMESDMSAAEFGELLRIPDEDIDEDRTVSHTGNNDGRSEAVDSESAFDLSGYLLSRIMNNADDGNSDAADGGDVDSDRANTNLTLMDDYSYAWKGLNCTEFKDSTKIRSLQQLTDAQGFTVTFDKDSPLRAWLRRRVPNTETLREDTGTWSTDASYCERMAHGITAQLRGENWSRTQYLWALNPLMEWISTKATSLLYRRGEAPIIGVTNGRLADDETIILLTGMIANEHATPVLDEWFGLRYRNDEFVDLLPMEDVWKITGYRGRKEPNSERYEYANTANSEPSEQQVEHAQLLLADAVRRGRKELWQRGDAYEQNVARPEIDKQLERITEWRNRRSLVIAGYSDLADQQRKLDDMYDEYDEWVNETLTASGEPVIRIAAAFVGVN